MKAMKPRAAFQVPNTLTGEGNINVELTFESMDDFSPAACAQGRRAQQAARGAPAASQPRSPTWTARRGAEELVGKLLQDPALLQTLARRRSPRREASRSLLIA
jgi:type VI secretion system protein ImpB